ncbi:MAG: hypothetical protein AB7F40_01635 [Victivallaceae bacterium]|nr:hypothetical protein [Victivallaceae bacterium]
MGEIFKNWGVSLSCRRPPALDEPLDYAQLAAFRNLEFPGAMLGRLELTTFVKQKKPAFLAFSRLLDSTLTRQAPELEGGLMSNFQEHFYRQAKLAGELGAVVAGADFDLEKAAADHDFHRRSGKLLRVLYAPWYDGSLLLSLPLRLPQTGGVKSDFSRIARALSDWMLPKLGVTLEIHIHELRFDDALKRVFDTFKYQTTMLRVIYEPELGNSLSGAILGELAENLSEFVSSRMVMLSPVHAQSDTFAGQLAGYPQLFTAPGGQQEEEKC